jgi:hypothetical protein
MFGKPCLDNNLFVPDGTLAQVWEYLVYTLKGGLDAFPAGLANRQARSLTSF